MCLRSLAYFIKEEYKEEGMFIFWKVQYEKQSIILVF